MTELPAQCEAFNYVTEQWCTLHDGHHGEDPNGEWDLHQDAHGNLWDSYCTTQRGRTLRITGATTAVVLQGFFTITMNHVVTCWPAVDLGSGITDQRCPQLEPPLITIDTTTPIPDIAAEAIRIELWSDVDGRGQQWAHFDFIRVASLALDRTDQDLITYLGHAVVDAENTTYCRLQITTTKPPE